MHSVAKIVRGRDHLCSPHFPSGLSGVCVLAGRCSDAGEKSEWRGKLSWREMPGGLCHISYPHHAAPFLQQLWFHAARLPTRLSWAGCLGCLCEVVLCLIQERAQRFGTKTQRGSTHPLLSHAKLGIAFPPAVNNACVYNDVSEFADVSPTFSPRSHRQHSSASGSENRGTSSFSLVSKTDSTMGD
ncbi:hypothetical protein Q7C36_006187 [Tachysurus vachellii]|uniref:Uncharacterized protein n=1 Tax=Tachysurus vachellii TaxID=175792 RepID=A0AA88T4F9_TACVA|nr:hypothetical protein Q7C36_006187 [Tachysurus vachellii]